MVRSAVVTVVIVVLAAAAHVIGGGHVPSGLAAGAVVVAVALTVHLVTRWRLSTPTIFALLAGGQLLLHHAFMSLDSARTGPLDVHTLNAMPMGRLAHAHSMDIDPSSMSSMSTMAMPSMAPPSTVMSSMAGGSMHTADALGVAAGPWTVTPMLAAHVAATVVTALVLASAERAVWRLWSWLAPLVVALFTPPQTVAVRLPRASRAAFERRLVHEVVLVRALSRRGPPVVPVHV